MAAAKDSPEVRIAVDAMGGDRGPLVALEAAVSALRTDPKLALTLFGDGQALEPEIEALEAGLRGRIRLVPTGHFIPQDASPARALRNGEGSSMSASIECVGHGQAGAMVSAGNTGALMALARARLGMLPGVERPALMTAFPVRGRRVWVLDLGANLGVDAERLFEFAVLGSAAVSCLLRTRPRVGLLNVGREPGKGPDVVREAARRLEDSPLNYVGFIEAHEVFEHRADVVVCDGFAGNVLLKCAEGAIGMALEMMDDAAGGWMSAWVVRRAMNRIRPRLDPSAQNGASLLGINGIVVKSHGRAAAPAFERAIALAALEVRRGMLPELERQLWESA